MPSETLCRICLQDRKTIKGMLNLLNDRKIVRKIEEVGGIKLELDDNLPSMFCMECAKMLDTSYKFRSLCQASNNAFVDFILITEWKPESQVSVSETPEEFGDNEATSKSEGEVFFAEFVDTQDSENLSEITDEFEPYDDGFAGFDGDESIQSLINEEIARKKKSKIKLKPKQHRSKLLIHRESKELKKNVIGSSKKTICEFCGNIYNNKSLLSFHTRCHMPKNKCQCEICGKTFPYSSEIRRHMRTHTGEKPYKCKFCDRTFADQSTHLKHERIHTNERPFSCMTCGKSFTYSNVLKSHMLTHTGEKPFSCDYCKKSFSRKHQLNQHYSTIIHQQAVANMSH